MLAVSKLNTNVNILHYWHMPLLVFTYFL